MTALSVAREEEMLRQVIESGGDGHILAPIQSSFDGKGRILVSRDGCRQFLHRRLFIATLGPLGPREYLYQMCPMWGCQQPAHFTTRRPQQRRCRNDHIYVQADRQRDGRFRCHQCRQKYNEGRRRGGEPHWMAEKKRLYCRYGHEYTPENTYAYPTPAGGVRRHCKTCVRLRRAGINPADQAQEIAPF